MGWLVSLALACHSNCLLLTPFYRIQLSSNNLHCCDRAHHPDMDYGKSRASVLWLPERHRFGVPIFGVHRQISYS